MSCAKDVNHLFVKLEIYFLNLIVICNSFVIAISDPGHRVAQQVTSDSDLRDAQRQLDVEKERQQSVRLQLAKKNRSIVSIQRQIDNIPDRTELAQYQRRFLELYNQGGCVVHCTTIVECMSSYSHSTQ